mmetsp:Transcript_72474/g.172775  ORF Transcript_72474/g.172775 Transcript_72474/m.172775 type:complete len:349 (+) Transcript_72474:123-1169(+)
MGACDSKHVLPCRRLNTNKPVTSTSNYFTAAPVHQGGENHVLICALDYKKTNNPLTCTLDAKNVKSLCEACGVRDVVMMLDEQCTREAVQTAIQQACRRCVPPNDVFIFYYSGHGVQVTDKNGDEASGQDDAFALVNEKGQISAQTLLLDDEFSDLLTANLHPTVRSLVLTDCCHSGTIADFSGSKWKGRSAISITGCTDEETSGDMGKGGIFTHSMLLAIDRLQTANMHDYSAGALYNATLKEAERVFHPDQDITLETPDGFTSDQLAWPLVPVSEYKAPLSKAADHANPEKKGNEQQKLVSTHPDTLASMGVTPEMLKSLKTNAINMPVKAEEYFHQIQRGQCPVQ